MPNTIASRRHRPEAAQGIVPTEDDDMKQLPPEIVETTEFRSSSLALRMVHQLLRPSLRAQVLLLKPDQFCATEARVLQRIVASQGVFVHEPECEELIKDALRTGLWERDKAGRLAIYSLPRSLAMPEDFDAEHE